MKNIKKQTLVSKISFPAEVKEPWKQVVDFTKIKKGGINIDQLLARL